VEEEVRTIEMEIQVKIAKPEVCIELMVIV
jgi:hypothetical protein